jgi:thymidylate synthase (FAD)
MLEHYIFVLSVPEDIYEDITNPVYRSTEFAEYNDKLSHIRFSRCYDPEHYEVRCLVSGSATAFNYLWEAISKVNMDHVPGIVKCCKFLQYYYPMLMKDPDGTTEVPVEEVPTRVAFVGRAYMKNLPYEIRLLHDWMSVKFTVDRGVTHELVRHRPCSWAQESTRYCNYSQGKHGNEITVIKPFFFEEGSNTYNEWKTSCENSERSYMNLLNDGTTPQFARTVLPNSLKAEIVMTARMYEMQHFFKMRAATDAHPQMREVSVPLLQEMVSSDPVMFDKYSSLIV